jgi:hypothetical protein
MTHLVLFITTLLCSYSFAYNETTGENECQPILKVFENDDPEVTCLTLQDTESSQLEMIVTIHST